jgi:AcrR family transcriptional regulator
VKEDAAMTAESDTGRVNQKKRTRMAILQACCELIRSGVTVTMPDVARRALVSEATAYRYFPDLASLVNEAFAGMWPSPAEALGPVAESGDPVERVAFACEFLLRGVLSSQAAVRAMISATIIRPELAAARPGIRFGLIDEALAPLAGPEGHRPRAAQPAPARPRRGDQRGSLLLADRPGPAHPRRRDRQPGPDRDGRHAGGPAPISRGQLTVTGLAAASLKVSPSPGG